MFSFRTGMFGSLGSIYTLQIKVAEAIAIVVTKSPAKQLITDLLICAQQQRAVTVTLPRFGLKEHPFKDLKTIRIGWSRTLFSIIINILKLMMTITVYLDISIRNKFCS